MEPPITDADSKVNSRRDMESVLDRNFYRYGGKIIYDNEGDPIDYTSALYYIPEKVIRGTVINDEDIDSDECLPF